MKRAWAVVFGVCAAAGSWTAAAGISTPADVALALDRFFASPAPEPASLAPILSELERMPAGIEPVSLSLSRAADLLRRESPGVSPTALEARAAKLSALEQPALLSRLDAQSRADVVEASRAARQELSREASERLEARLSALARALNADMNPYTLRSQVVTPGGARFSVRPAEPSDVPKVTALIHDAFEVWKREGLSLSPMRQTDEDTARHLLGKGYVVENERGELAATFSLDEGRLSKAGARSVDYTEGADAPVRFSLESGAPESPEGPLLVFKKFAVRQDSANAGLGSRLYELVEGLGRAGYRGMVLETVREAHWLYDWYRRLGYGTVGVHRYDGSSLDTVLMVKPLGGKTR